MVGAKWPHTAELEALPEKLKFTKVDLKKATDKLDAAQSHLISMETDLNQKLKDQEKQHQDAIQKMLEDHQATLAQEKDKYAFDLAEKSKEVSEAQKKLQKLKEEQDTLAREAIISYIACDTFTVNRLEEFWSRVEKFITPRVSSYVTSLKKSPNPQEVKWDSKWLTHEKLHHFSEGWGVTPKESSKLPSIPLRPTSEQALWDLE